MRILNPRNHHLRIWFPDQKSLQKFKEEYNESVNGVNMFEKDFVINGEKGRLLVIDLIKNLEKP